MFPRDCQVVYEFEGPLSHEGQQRVGRETRILSILDSRGLPYRDTVLGAQEGRVEGIVPTRREIRVEFSGNFRRKDWGFGYMIIDFGRKPDGEEVELGYDLASSKDFEGRDGGRNRRKIRDSYQRSLEQLSSVGIQKLC